MPSSSLRRAVCSLLLLSVSLAACTKNGDVDAAETDDPNAQTVSAEEAGAPRASVALPVVAQEATEGDLVLRVNARGDIYGDVVVKLSSDVSGRVADVLVKAGSRVSKGQPLVKLDQQSFDFAVREAQASLEEREQAFRESFVPESLVTGVGPTDAQRRALRIRSGVQRAEIALDKAKWERDRSVVLSPVNGFIDRLDLAVGEQLGAGTPFATVVDVGSLRIEARVIEDDMPLIRVGGEAVVTSPAVPGRSLRGRIDAVLPMIDSMKRVGRVIVRVPGESALRPGMYADVQLEAQRLPGRIMVPAKAVIERDGRPLVFVVREGRGQWTYIQPGRTNGVDTEVLPDSSTGVIPISAGDQIIVDGHLTLTHDAAVTISTLRERDDAPTRRTPASVRRNDK
jgi:HlyD family secretion protein